MALIKADLTRINALCNSEKNIAGKAGDCAGHVSGVISRLDWEVASKNNINDRLNAVKRRLQKQEELMQRYANALNEVSAGMDAKDKDIRNRAKNIVYNLGMMKAAAFTYATPARSYANTVKLEKITATMALFSSAGLSAESLAVFARLRELIADLRSSLGGSDSTTDGANSSKPYTLSITQIDNTIIYERVYSDGHRERISEQGFRVEQARGYVDYSTWGKEPSSISKLDYALIADIPNKSHDEALQYIRENFPDNHPFRQGDFIHSNIAGLDYCVFKVDDNHAIVSFGGTKDGGDIAADIQLATGQTPYQASTANAIINMLPYDNIVVTGHSLGGYLAADVAINSDKISECVTFDAPGRTGADAIGYVNNLNSKITNHSAIGDNVHNVGIQPGRSYSVDVGSNPDNMGPLGNHSLTDLIDAFCK